MEELIKVNEETMTVSARDLHEKLEIGTKFTTWFERMCDYGFSKGIEFFPKMGETSEVGGRPSVDYEISIDMAKQICMIQRTEIGKTVRQYFIDLEKAWNTPQQVMARALKIADRTIANLTATIEEQKPLVQFAKHVSESADTVDMEEMAKIAASENIKIGRNRLISWLKDKKILQDNRLPYQTFIDRGYFDVVEVTKKTIYGDKIFYKTVVTGKGQIWVIEKLKAEYGEEN